ncbi:MAG: FKBP-type peptidyl-prolyl cis-trans isomerase [Bacteroidota bacterium]
MLKTKIFLVFFLIAGAFSSCKKDNYDAEQQLAIDDGLIKDFITKNSIAAVKDEDSGIYYQVIASGSGSINYTAATRVTVNYEGRLLNGSVFDKSSSAKEFTLGKLVQGWQIGLRHIQKGGKIRLLIPSTLGYMNQASVGIPENSVLDFTIELINAQ